MGKKKLIILISSIASFVVIAVAVTLILVFTLGGKSNNNNSDEGRLLDSARNIKVVQVDGSATVSYEEENANCFKGMNLYDGDTVLVNNESTIVIKFDEDKYVYLGENTKIKIKSEGNNKYKTNVFVLYGVVLAEVQNKLGEDEEFFLSSNNSVMAVRGTIFGVSVKKVGNEIIQAYSVYKGVTELYVFDKNGNDFISGKLTDITDSKYELRIPEDHILSEEEMNEKAGVWLDKVNANYDDAEDANNKLDEVEITVSKPTEEDFDKAQNIINENKDPDKKEQEPISFTSIPYQANGFFGEYDGLGHSINVTSKLDNVKITYKGENENEYKEVNDYVFYSPGSYRVYYKIECEGYDTKEDYEVVYITKPTITLTSDRLIYDNQSQASILNLGNMPDTSFNRYNGILASDLLSNAQYFINDTDITDKLTNISYNKKVDGYIELVDGKNTLNATFTFDDFTLNTDVYFLFSDTREDLGYLIGSQDSALTNLSGNLYFYESGNGAANYITVDGNDLLTMFGLDVEDLTTMLINYPDDVIKTNISNYNGTNSINIYIDEFVELNFLVFPTSQTKGYSDTVYIYVSNEAPVDYPTYTIKNTKYSYSPEKNPDGVLIDFIQSEDTVSYSLNDKDYFGDLSIPEPGIFKVYYKVSKNDLVISNYEYITIVSGQGNITFDNMKFITNPVHIFSNDGNDLSFTYYDETILKTEYVTSTNGQTITSLGDAYTVYSDMIKNAKFYDSLTEEELDAVVTISEKKDNSANFNYTISVDGYNTLSGTVRFVYSEIGELDGQANKDISVTTPTDYTVSLSEVPTIIPGRISTSIENDYINYQCYYSIDEGKTWSKSSPKITEVGNYKVYTLYCLVDKGNDATELVDGELANYATTNLAANGNFIIAIQNITVTE